MTREKKTAQVQAQAAGQAAEYARLMDENAALKAQLRDFDIFGSGGLKKKR